MSYRGGVGGGFRGGSYYRGGYYNGYRGYRGFYGGYYRPYGYSGIGYGWGYWPWYGGYGYAYPADYGLGSYGSYPSYVIPATITRPTPASLPGYPQQSSPNVTVVYPPQAQQPQHGLSWIAPTPSFANTISSGRR